jgi:hypothetical protein
MKPGVAVLMLFGGLVILPRCAQSKSLDRPQAIVNLDDFHWQKGGFGHVMIASFMFRNVGTRDARISSYRVRQRLKAAPTSIICARLFTRWSRPESRSAFMI